MTAPLPRDEHLSRNGSSITLDLRALDERNEAGLWSYARAIAGAPEENKFELWRKLAREAARGGNYPKSKLADVFQELAENHGLVDFYGQDAIQSALAESLNSADDPTPSAESNSESRLAKFTFSSDEPPAPQAM